MLKGLHLIAGEWMDSKASFTNEPVTGTPDSFSAGSVELVDRACKAAEDAFLSYGYSTRDERAKFLRTIAAEIDARGDDITAMGTKETGLPEGRLIGERGRTVGQLRLFADHLEEGDYLDRRHVAGQPEAKPAPRPDLHMIQRPVGPVAVFGASNFPLAFSSAGGDTAAALAAGCPVVVKGHSAHPGVADIVAQAIDAARIKCNLHAGVFSQVQGGNRQVGQAVVQHPLIKAVGFTGSLAGGRALFDLCAARPEPIPFFGELGSINPMFVLDAALAARGGDIAKGWAASLSMGAGQFCTNPGVAVVSAGSDSDSFIQSARAALETVGAQTMLTDGIAAAYHKGQERVAAFEGVEAVLTTACDNRDATPFLFATTGEQWLKNEDLGEEVFGPLGLILLVKDETERLAVANSLKGQLTATLHVDDSDTDAARQLVPVLERKVGRILANGFPTGVDVSDAMVHGGPYPASTNFGATSVGTLSIRRFLRPVCYQDMPNGLLPLDVSTS